MGTQLTINPNNLDFELPDHCIAQEPSMKRDEARLMVVKRPSHSIENRHFFDLGDFLGEGDVLVLNKAKVNPAKLQGQKKTGGRVELILLAPTEKPTYWKALVRPFLPVGTDILFIRPGKDSAQVRLVGRNDVGENIIDLGDHQPQELLSEFGELPLPPYIKRSVADERKSMDAEYYQTVYASVPGSIAAPTAGLHFTDSLLEQLKKKGVQILDLVLHVGWGTFKPVQSLQDHQMLAEQYFLSASTWTNLKKARLNRQRIVAVGTTVTRVLESLTDLSIEGDINGETSIFIKPGFSFQWVSALVTNFHVPRSTPISLVSAFAGTSLIEKSYELAIEQGYRFFSYGDAMLIL